MAMESSALLNVLIAFASGHLSIVDHSYKVAALEAKSTAIRSLASAINTVSEEVTYHETNAAACLSFVIYEAGVGDCRAWLSHLKGTQNIIKSACVSSGGQYVNGPEAFKHSTEGQWILRNYAYHDIIGSITLRTTPLLYSDYLDGITDIVDSCVGVAAGLLAIIARISFLDKETTIHDHEWASGHNVQWKLKQLESTSADIEQKLQNWQCHADASPGLAALAYAYRNAALMVLYRLIRGRLRSSHGSVGEIWGSDGYTLDEVEARIQGQVVDTLRHISDIPVSSAPEGALLFPIFIVGGEAVEQEHIDSVRSRLRLMADKRQFRNLSQARDVLEDLWDLRKTTQGQNADWTQILDASGEDLLLT
ncbi:Armadillo-like helical [Purpureocillium lavendulum]|uniref:Armadillo-like helical n=1 Tax=Purpureocillium lavendulum TaxID=1247861 RepID=A0AB34FTW3_9HYPO|nr:Armadillo-like helical [Purpureocillium lavendulum]